MCPVYIHTYTRSIFIAQQHHRAASWEGKIRISLFFCLSTRARRYNILFLQFFSAPSYYSLAKLLCVCVCVLFLLRYILPLPCVLSNNCNEPNYRALAAKQSVTSCWAALGRRRSRIGSAWQDTPATRSFFLLPPPSLTRKTNWVLSSPLHNSPYACWTLDAHTQPPAAYFTPPGRDPKELRVRDSQGIFTAPQNICRRCWLVPR